MDECPEEIDQSPRAGSPPFRDAVTLTHPTWHESQRPDWLVMPLEHADCRPRLCVEHRDGAVHRAAREPLTVRRVGDAEDETLGPPQVLTGLHVHQGNEGSVKEREREI